MVEAKVRRIEPLKCPQCGSTEVKQGFTNRRGSAFLADGDVYCFACKVKTTKSGKVKAFKKHWTEYGDDET